MQQCPPLGGPLSNAYITRSVHPPRRRPRTAPRPRAPAGRDKTKKKASISSGAWEEARALVWTHRHRLALGLVLMVVNRLAGLVLPATSKYLMDDVIGQAELGPAAEAGAGRRRGDARRRGDVVRQLADPRRRRAARDHRHAQGGRGARHAPADPLFRFDEDRHPHLADHDRRRGHPEPRRHRPGAADRLDPDRDHGAVAS